MKYDWLLFDLDNTILDFDQAMVFALKKTIAEHHIPEQEDHLTIYNKINKRCWEEMEKGIITQERLRTLRMERFLNHLEMDISPIQFSEAYHFHLANDIYFMPDAKELIEEWSAQFPLALVTNGLKEIQRTRLEKSDLEKHFQHIIISDEIGIAKPHQAFFDHVFEKIDFPKKEKVMIIGDSLSSDIRGGNDYGIATCWLNLQNKAIPEDNAPTFTIGNLGELRSVIG